MVHVSEPVHVTLFAKRVLVHIIKNQKKVDIIKNQKKKKESREKTTLNYPGETKANDRCPCKIQKKGRQERRRTCKGRDGLGVMQPQAKE